MKTVIQAFCFSFFRHHIHTTISQILYTKEIHSNSNNIQAIDRVRVRVENPKKCGVSCHCWCVPFRCSYKILRINTGVIKIFYFDLMMLRTTIHINTIQWNDRLNRLKNDWNSTNTKIIITFEWNSVKLNWMWFDMKF